MITAPIERRSPEVVLLLALVTCGLYLIYWYMCMYRELEQLRGEPLTGTGFWIDFVLVVCTAGIWGLWVDYRMANAILELEERNGMQVNRDHPTLIVVLDLGLHITLGFTFALTSAIMQDHLNKLMKRINEGAVVTAEPVAPLPAA